MNETLKATNSPILNHLPAKEPDGYGEIARQPTASISVLRFTGWASPLPNYSSQRLNFQELLLIRLQEEMGIKDVEHLI